mmetsp:Transcript_49231/g.123774  ORF Transcript_49231/g.123774 Transcript_49231/m.123774 type:complete len:316 (+) Transcript_49231:94-1041(+)
MRPGRVCLHQAPKYERSHKARAHGGCGWVAWRLVLVVVCVRAAVLVVVSVRAAVRLVLLLECVSWLGAQALQLAAVFARAEEHTVVHHFHQRVQRVRIRCAHHLLFQYLKAIRPDDCRHFLVVQLHRFFASHVKKMVQQWSYVDPQAVRLQRLVDDLHVVHHIVGGVHKETRQDDVPLAFLRRVGVHLQEVPRRHGKIRLGRQLRSVHVGDLHRPQLVLRVQHIVPRVHVGVDGEGVARGAIEDKVRWYQHEVRELVSLAAKSSPCNLPWQPSKPTARNEHAHLVPIFLDRVRVVLRQFIEQKAIAYVALRLALC